MSLEFVIHASTTRPFRHFGRWRCSPNSCWSRYKNTHTHRMRFNDYVSTFDQHIFHAMYAYPQLRTNLPAHVHFNLSDCVEPASRNEPNGCWVCTYTYMFICVQEFTCGRTLSHGAHDWVCKFPPHTRSVHMQLFIYATTSSDDRRPRVDSTMNGNDILFTAI